MTPNEIIKEIKRLDLKEQLGVIRFAHRLGAGRRLTGKELSELAEQMVKTTDPTEEAIIREAMIRGFYGVAASRTGSAAKNKRAISQRHRNKRTVSRS